MKKHLAKSLTLLLVSFIHVSAQSDDSLFKAFKESWAKYASGEFETAQRMIENVAIAEIEHPLLRGNLYYLTGLLESNKDPENAIPMIELAREAYQDAAEIDILRKGGENGIKTADMVLARLYVQAEKLLKAANILDEYAADHNSDGHVLHLKARLAFLVGDYEEALSLGKLAVLQFKLSGDERRTAQAKTNVGLYQMLTGELEEGFQTTLAGQPGITKRGATGQYYYSLINMIIYQRCFSGSSAKGLIRNIEKRLEEEPDLDLKKLLKFASEYNCPE